MRVARNTTHGLRHDWLMFDAHKGRTRVSLLACRNSICVDIEYAGKETFVYMTPAQLAEALASYAEKIPQ